MYQEKIIALLATLDPCLINPALINPTLINSTLINSGRLSYKKLFGAVAAYIDGQIFCTCGRFGFALKLSTAHCQDLLDSGASPLKYFEKGHIKKNYAVLTPAMMAPDRLSPLIALSLDHAVQTKTAAPKKKKPEKKT